MRPLGLLLLEAYARTGSVDSEPNPITRDNLPFSVDVSSNRWSPTARSFGDMIRHLLEVIGLVEPEQGSFEVSDSRTDGFERLVIQRKANFRPIGCILKLLHCIVSVTTVEHRDQDDMPVLSTKVPIIPLIERPDRAVTAKEVGRGTFGGPSPEQDRPTSISEGVEDCSGVSLCDALRHCCSLRATLLQNDAQVSRCCIPRVLRCNTPLTVTVM
jgi:hypothetical protein